MAPAVPEAPGTVEDLRSALSALIEELSARPRKHPPFVQLCALRGSDMVTLRGVLEDLLPGAPLRLAGPPRLLGPGETEEAPEEAQIEEEFALDDEDSPERLVAQAWSKKLGGDMPDAAREVFRQLLQAVRREEAQS